MGKEEKRELTSMLIRLDCFDVNPKINACMDTRNYRNAIRYSDVKKAIEVVVKYLKE